MFTLSPITWIRQLLNAFTRGRVRRYSSRPKGFKLAFDTLEDRLVPSTVTISNFQNASEDGSTPGIFRVSRGSDTNGDLTVNYAFDSSTSTATSGTDFSTLGTSVTILDGTTYADIDVAAINDSVYEGNESVKVDLQGGACGACCSMVAAYALGSPSTATLSILDNETLQTVTISKIQDASESGTLGIFRVSRGSDTNGDLTVNYAFDSSTSTATAGADFASLSGSVTIPDGSTFADIDVAAINDSVYEGNESVKVDLQSGACGACCSMIAAYTLGSPSTATLSILDNETLQTVTISKIQDASESGTPGIFRVSRGSDTNGDLTVNYAFDSSTSTATAGADFASLSGSVTIPDGSTFADIDVSAVDDSCTEGPETVKVDLQNGSCGACCAATPTYALGSPSTATLTIVDNDVNTVTLTAPGGQRNNEWDNVSLQVSATDALNTPVTYSAAGLPAGLAIDDGTGLITGLLDDQTAGTYQVTITASDDSDTKSATFAWTVYPPITVTISDPGDVNLGDTIQFVATATGGSGTGYTFTWDFGDGGAGAGGTVTYIYQGQDGGNDFAPNVTVSDDFNNTTVETTEIAVLTTPTIGDETVDESSDPAVQLATQSDFDDANAAIQAADQQALDDMLPLEQEFPLPPDDGGPTLADTLAADNAVESAAMVAADSQYAVSLVSDGGQYAAGVQAALDAFNAAADLTNSQYDSTVDQANLGYTSNMASIDQSFLDVTSAADNTFQQAEQNNDQALTAQLTDLQTSLDAQVDTDESNLTDQITSGQTNLQQLLDTDDQAYSDQVQGLADQESTDITAIDAAAANITALADAAAQGTYDGDQTSFDQAVADAEAAYQAGTDDEADTEVPDFSQDPGFIAATADAQAAYDAATQQADDTLNQQMQDIQANLQAVYDSATAAYNQTLADAAAAEAATDAQADQSYDAAIAADQQVHDASVAQAQSTYDQATQVASDNYDATTAQAGQDRQAAQALADSNYQSAISAAWDVYNQAAQQATDTYNAVEQAARTTYDTTTTQAQSSYDATAANLQQTFDQQKQQAQNINDSAIIAANNARASALSAAQTVYDAADQAANAVLAAAYQPAWNQYLSTTTQIDSQYTSARQTIRVALQGATATANRTYQDSVRAAADAFWAFKNTTYARGIRRADATIDPALKASLYASLQSQQQQAKKDYVLAVDAARIQLIQDLGTAQIFYQPDTNAAEKAKFDGYTNARVAFNNAMNAAQVAYAQAIAQPSATLMIAKAQAQATWLNTVADAGQVLADAQADAEAQYDSGITTARRTLADIFANANQALYDTLDPAAQTRDTAQADAQLQLDESLADAQLTWSDAREAALTAEERTNSAAYASYIDTVTAAGVALDDAVTSADVTQAEADAAAGVAWTTTVTVGWQTRQNVETNAVQQWFDVTGTADISAANAVSADLMTCNTTVDAAYQSEANAILSASGNAVHAWAQTAGTRYAQLIDIEMSAWISGERTNVSAAISDDEADFNAQVAQQTQEFEAADAAQNSSADAFPGAVQAEIAAAVAEIEAESQAAANTANAEQETWQSDEHAASEDERTHDQNDAAAAVTDANADQDAEAAWEHSEALSARADEIAVAQAEDQSANTEANATRTGNDAIGAAILAQANGDAIAAQSRDTAVAVAHHDMVYSEAVAEDSLVHTGTTQVGNAVTHDANAYAAEVPQAAAIILAQYQARNAAVARDDILNHDAAQTALITQEIRDRDTRVATAQQVLATDQAADVLSPQFVTANPQVPESVIQIVNDYTPDVKTVVFIGAMVGVAVLVPGAGPVLLAVAAGTLVSRGVDRYFDGNQSLMQACVGATADATGISEVYQAFTNQDIATGGHMNLSVAEQRRIIGTTVLQFTVGAAAGAGARFARSRTPAAPQQPTTPAQAPARPTNGSNAGRPGAAQQAQSTCPCFPAGTPIRTLHGVKPIEQIRAGDIVLSRMEHDPTGRVLGQPVEEVFFRVSPVLHLIVGGRSIKVTAEHPFYAEGRGWVPAGFLNVGELLHTLDGGLARLEQKSGPREIATVYNFRVSEYHTYFIGDSSWEIAIWTHNSPCTPAGSTPQPTPSGNIKVTKSEAEAAAMAEAFKEGQVTRPIVDRGSGTVVGEITADGNRVIRYPHTDRGTPEVHWNLENKTTGQNIHVVIE